MNRTGGYYAKQLSPKEKDRYVVIFIYHINMVFLSSISLLFTKTFYLFLRKFIDTYFINMPYNKK